MSDKNPQTSILGKNKRLTDVITYEIDGVRYRETISLDTANGNFGRSIKIEEQYVRTRVPIIDPYPRLAPVYDYREVTDQDILKKIQKNEDRADKYGGYLVGLQGLDNLDESLDASDMDQFIDSFADGETWKNIPLPDAKSKTEDPKGGTTKIEPSDIFGDYKVIFNQHLKYPRDLFTGGQIPIPFANADPTEGSQDYVFIEQFVYKAPQAVTNTKTDATFETGGRTRTPSLVTGGLGRRTNLGDPMGSCILPIPNRLSVSQGVNWGEGKANAVQLSAFQGVNNILTNTFKEKGSNLVGLLGAGLKEGRETFNSLKEDINKAGEGGGARASTVLNAVVARSILSRIGINVDVDQFITRETGAAINPNLELLFGGPQLRTFSFLFNFAPNDEEEAKTVRMIQRWFRQGMLAQKTTAGVGGGSLFLGSPNIFRVCYKNNKRRIKGLNTFKICAVTSVEIDFTPDNVYQSYEDADAISQPVRSSMAVTFNELTPIFANDYNLDEDEQGNLDPSLSDLGANIRGENEFTEDDLGF
tara:strand:+ start:43 stop:1635 length:1593 start_codon:yes stop_codon:yes gene_type:complete